MNEDQKTKIAELNQAVRSIEKGKQPNTKQAKILRMLDVNGLQSTYESIAQAVSSTGVPKHVFIESRGRGCSSFRSQRIFFSEWLRWYFDPANSKDGDDVKLDYAEEIKKEDWITKRNARLAAEGKFILRDEVEAQDKSSMAMMFGELDRMFVGDFPQRADGLSKVEMSKLAEETIERIKTEFRRRFEELAKKSKKPEQKDSK